MRLIDANALWAEFMELADTSIEFDGEGVANAIANAPTIDAVEVVHGRWIICSDGYYPYCSVCNEEPKHGDMTNYCPNCGADMRERREGE